MRRPQSAHATAFLIDQDRRIVAPDALPQRVGQRLDLRRVIAIAGEQNEAQRIGSGKKPHLVIAELGTGAAEDDRLGPLALTV
jgi:hypothetical protein